MASISAALAISCSPFPVRNRSLPRPKPSISCSSGPPPDSGSEKKAPNSLWGISTNTWCAGLGGLGVLETGYLAYVKITNSEAFCSVGVEGAGSCRDVLNSDYASVFGFPLPLIGMVAYGLVVSLSFQWTRENLVEQIGESGAQLLLLGITTSMATASAYFLYLLSTTLAGTFCSYCLVSASLSFSLFFITLQNFGLENIRKVVGLQLAVTGVVVAALSSSYTMASPQVSSSSELSLEPYETVITNHSSPLAISIAQHLHSIGAKMYGAFWCSHCIEQKQMFGQEAAKILDYVECFPKGVGKGRKMAPLCAAAGVEGFPTWIIKNEVLSGEQELSALAEASGFVLEDSQAS